MSFDGVFIFIGLMIGSNAIASAMNKIATAINETKFRR